MSDNSGNIINLNRTAIRMTLLDTIKELEAIEDINIRDILSEMLSIAASIVHKPETELQQIVIKPFEDEVDSEEEQEFSDPWREIHESDIHKKMNDLYNNAYGCRKRGDYREELAVTLQTVDLYPAYLAKIKKVLPDMSLDSYTSPLREHIYKLLKAAVADLDDRLFEETVENGVRLAEAFNFTEPEFFKLDCDNFRADMDTMRTIYEFLSENSDFIQSKLWSELSLNGTKCLYMIDWAVKLGRIESRRDKKHRRLRVVSLPS